jgi:rhodanese-related sulfurtransferase
MTLFRRRKVSDIDALSASQLITSGKATLLDVREADEWAAGHAPNALHIPLGELVVSKVTSDNLVVAVCRSGRRSAKATALLRAAGIEIRNLSGGMQAWSLAGLPVLRADGSPGVIA